MRDSSAPGGPAPHTTPRRGADHAAFLLPEPLEPRLLLSGFPTIQETLADHSTLAAAQSLTAEMTELEPGEGSFGVYVEGALEAGQTDWYRVDFAAEAVGFVEFPIDPWPYPSGYAYEADGQEAQVRRYTDTRWFWYGPAGTYYVAVGTTPHSGYSYHARITATYGESGGAFAPLSYDLDSQGAVANFHISSDDPADLLLFDNPPDDVRTILSPDGSSSNVEAWNANNVPSLPDGANLVFPKTVPQTWAGTLFQFSSGNQDLSEPNDTPAEAIDVTAYLHDAGPFHRTADRLLYLQPSREDGTDDWYKFTLAEPLYVGASSPVKDAAGDPCAGVLSPGTYYIKSQDYGYGDYAVRLGLQTLRDGGGLAEIEPGLWHATLQPTGPGQTRTFTLAQPADVYVEMDCYHVEPYVPGGDPEYVTVTTNLYPQGDRLPIEVYAYETTPVAPGSTSAATATPLKMMPRAGSADHLLGMAVADQPADEDWFCTLDLPWPGVLSLPRIYNSSADAQIYDGQGQVVPMSYYSPLRIRQSAPVEAGTYYLVLPGRDTPRSWRVWAGATRTGASPPQQPILDITEDLLASRNLRGELGYSTTLPPVDVFDQGGRFTFTVDFPFELTYGDLTDTGGTWHDEGEFLPAGTYEGRRQRGHSSMTGENVSTSVSLQAYNPIESVIDLDPLFVETEPGVWRAEPDPVPAADFTFTVETGDVFTVAMAGEGRYFILDEAGGELPAASGEYFQNPGTYTVRAFGQTQPIQVTVEKRSYPTLTFTAISGRPDVYEAWITQDGWYAYLANSSGSLWAKHGYTAVPNRAATPSASAFAPGTVVWVKKSTNDPEIQVVLDLSAPVDTTANFTQAEAVDVDGLWWHQPEGADALLLNGQFNGTDRYEWYSFDLAVGDCFFAIDSARQWDYLQSLKIYAPDGSEAKQWYPVTQDGTYFLRAEAQSGAAPQRYGVFLQKVSNAVRGDDSYPVNIDHLYTPGEDLSFTHVYGKVVLTELRSDVGWSVEVRRVTNLAWPDEPTAQYYVDVPTNSNNFVDTDHGPAHVTIHFTATDEVEVNDTLAEAQDITDLLIGGGSTKTVTFHGAGHSGNEDYFKVRVDDWTLVHLTCDQAMDLLDADGNLLQTGVDVEYNLAPGAFYVRYPEHRGLYQFDLTISPGTDPGSDGDDTWQEATSLNHLLDGQRHTVDGTYGDLSDEDWYVFEPTGSPYVVQFDNAPAPVDWSYEYNGVLFPFSAELTRDASWRTVVVYDAPVLIRWTPQHLETTYSFTFQEITPAQITPWVPSATDPDVSTFDPVEEGGLLFQVPMGSGMDVGWTGGRIAIAQPAGLYNPSVASSSGLRWVFRDTYAYVYGYPGQDITLTRYHQLDAELGESSAAGQGHYDYAVPLTPDLSGKNVWVSRPHGSHSESQLGFDRELGGAWPDLAHILRLPGVQNPVAAGRIWQADEAEPNDTQAAAQRIDGLWQPYLSEGQKLELAGWAGPDDSGDWFVFHLSAGEAVYLGPDEIEQEDSGAVLTGQHLIDRGNGYYAAAADGDVYLTGMADEYQLTLYRGADAGAALDAGQAVDITDDLADGAAALVSPSSYVTFQALPGHVYAVPHETRISTDAGEVIWCRDRPNAVAFLAEDARYVVSISPYYGKKLIEILDVTDRAIDANPLLAGAGENVRMAEITLQDGDVFLYDADVNETITFTVTTDADENARDFSEPELFLYRADGTRAYATTYYAWEGRTFQGATGRFAGLVRGSGTITVTLTLMQTEPEANNTYGTATDLTGLLQDAEAKGQFAAYVGVLTDDDPVDYLRVHVEPGQYVTTYMLRTDANWDVYGYDTRDEGQGAVTAWQVGGEVATEYYKQYALGKVAQEPTTRIIKLSRPSYPGPAHYEVRIAVRDVFVPELTDLGGGCYEGEWSGEILLTGGNSETFDADLYAIQVPSQSVIRTTEALYVLDSEGRRMAPWRIIWASEGTYYVARWFRVLDSYPYTTNRGPYDMTVQISSTTDLDPDVIETIDYTLDEITRLQAPFPEEKSKWWHLHLEAGYELTLGRPLEPVDQTDVFLFRGPGVAQEWDITPEEPPPLFGEGNRYRILDTDDYYIQALPGVLSNGEQWDVQVLVQDLPDPYEPNDTADQAFDLSADVAPDANGVQTVTLVSTLEDTDVDFFSLQVPADQRLAVSVRREGGYWKSKLDLQIIDPDGRLVWSGQADNNVYQTVYAAAAGEYVVRVAGLPIAYNLYVGYQPTVPVALADGEQWIAAPADQPWMARLDLPAGTRLDFKGRYPYVSPALWDARGHQLQATCGEYVGLPEAGVYTIDVGKDWLWLDVEFDSPHVAEPGNHSVATAQPLDGLLTPVGQGLAGQTYVLGQFAEIDRKDYYSLQLQPGDAVQIGAVGHRPAYGVPNVRPVLTVLWNGEERSFADGEILVAEHEGVLVFSLQSEYEDDCYRLAVARAAAGQTGTVPKDPVVGNTMSRQEFVLAAGEGTQSLQSIRVYDDQFRFLGQTAKGAWFAPADGTYHVFSAQETTAQPAVLRPGQVVHVAFGGGAVGQVPELGVDLGQLVAFEAADWGLSSRQAELEAAVLARLEAKFAGLDITFVTEPPESLPYSTLYVTSSTPVDEACLAMLDGLNADQYDDAYVLSPNVLARGGGLGAYADWSDAEKFDAAATALANVAAAAIARAIGVQPVEDPTDLMAVNAWSDLSIDLDFSDENRQVAGQPVVQNSVYVLAQALTAHTPNATIEVRANDTLGEAMLLSVAQPPVVLGSISAGDDDYFRFVLDESSWVDLTLTGQADGVQMSVLDSAGTSMLQSDPGDASLVSLLEAGDYYLLLTKPATPSPGGMMAPSGAPVGGQAYVLSVAVVVDEGAPTADAGADQVVFDDDGDWLGAVRLDASGSLAAGGASYVWECDGQIIARGTTADVVLPIGTHAVLLTVTDPAGRVGRDVVEIVVNAALGATPVGLAEAAPVTWASAGAPVEVAWTGTDPAATLDLYVMGPGGWQRAAGDVPADQGGAQWDPGQAPQGWYRLAAEARLGAARVASFGAGSVRLSGATVLYDPSLGTAPGAQGWLYGTDPLLGASATQTLTADGVVLDTTAAIGDAAGYFSKDFAGLGWEHPAMVTLDRQSGYAVRFTLRLLSEDHGNADRAGFSVLALSSDGLGVELGFWTGEVWAQSGSDFTHAEGALIDTTAALAEYDLQVFDQTYRLSSGGTQILSGSLRDYAAGPHPVYRQTNLLFFGDDTSSARARAELGSVIVIAD